MPRVWTARDPAEAHLVREALRLNGVAADVRIDVADEGGGPPLPQGFQHSVWVADDDAERARALVHRLDRRRLAQRTPHCEGCGDHR